MEQPIVPRLDDMALFVEVVNAGSFRGAAQTTGIPNSTISRRIALLEKDIGLRLLHRTTRKIALTEAGQVYSERCKHIVAEASLAHQQLTRMTAQPHGVLRVSLPVDFGATYLAPLIGQFAERYPDLSFEFDLTPRRSDLVSEPLDVAIRIGELPDSSMIARQIAQLPGFLYAAPAYIDRHPPLEHPLALSAHECIRLSASATPNIWKLYNASGRVEVPVSGRFSINNMGMIHRLAIQGLGIAALTPEIVGDDLQAGRLRRVLPEWAPAPVPIHAVTETRLLPAKTQRFIEFMSEQLQSRPVVA
ncbi:MAG: LysR family transcriptional regulator [Xanthomonadaceae bacterium]|jgi:DNA-binding transcriptional LysR family regulator|nr:LysR family transcriptional regulator [Xanthomonadaceae bacterium]